MPVKTYRTYPPSIPDPKYSGGKMFNTKGIRYRFFKRSPDVKLITVDADQDQLDILEARGYAK